MGWIVIVGFRKSEIPGPWLSTYSGSIRKSRFTNHGAHQILMNNYLFKCRRFGEPQTNINVPKLGCWFSTVFVPYDANIILRRSTLGTSKIRRWELSFGYEQWWKHSISQRTSNMTKQPGVDSLEFVNYVVRDHGCTIWRDQLGKFVNGNDTLQDVINQHIFENAALLNHKQI